MSNRELQTEYGDYWENVSALFLVKNVWSLNLKKCHVSYNRFLSFNNIVGCYKFKIKPGWEFWALKMFNIGSAAAYLLQ